MQLPEAVNAQAVFHGQSGHPALTLRQIQCVPGSVTGKGTVSLHALQVALTLVWVVHGGSSQVKQLFDAATAETTIPMAQSASQAVYLNLLFIYSSFPYVPIFSSGGRDFARAGTVVWRASSN